MDLVLNIVGGDGEPGLDADVLAVGQDALVSAVLEALLAGDALVGL